MKTLRPIFFASFFFSIHLALLTYLNSSMLEQFASETMVSTFYTIGAALSLILVFYSPRIVSKIGLVRFSAIAFFLSIALLFVLGSAGLKSVVIPAFVMYISFNAVIIYAIDLFIEHYSREASTGNIRGTLLTFNNIGWVIAPITSGFLTAKYGFTPVYMLGALFVFGALALIILSQKKFEDREYKPMSIADGYHQMRASHPLRRIITINFMLQFFFAWMVIYVPIYLTLTIGFNWKEMGILLSIMLLPFALFVYPVGRLVDRIGEKPFIVGGLSIMALSTFLFAFLGAAPFAVYAVILFLTRVGASMLEVSSDSFFFKRLNDTDVSMISFYRNAMPIAYIIGPMTGALILMLTTHQTLFAILSVLLAFSTAYSFRLNRP